MKKFDCEMSANLQFWNEITPVHIKNYGVDDFLAGKCTLKKIELAELGDVKGKRILHLQCHFGLDSLSLARLGAEVVGVDFSDIAIAKAIELAEITKLNAQFICSNIYDCIDKINGKFDIVYTSIGVLCWLGDLDRWADIISHFLARDGFFYIYEAHPFCGMFEYGEKFLSEIKYSYFSSGDAQYWDDSAPDYADKSYIVRSPSYEWQWSLADIINALLRAKLALDFVHEHDTMPYDGFAEMQRAENGFFVPQFAQKLPLAFSICARHTVIGVL